MFGALPALIRVESGKHQCWWLKRAISVAQGDPNAVVAKSDQVGFAITRHINHKARVLIDAPALVISEVRDHEFRRLECAVAIAQGDPHAVIAKSDEVSLTVPGNIGHKAWMPIDAPALVVSQVRNDELHTLEGAIPIVS